MQSEALSAKQKKLKSWIILITAVVAVLLLVLLGLRLRGWRQNGQDSRMTSLVNPWNGADNSGFTPHLSEFEEIRVDKSMTRDLGELLAACRQAGYAPRLTAGYRSREEQQELFDETVRGLLSGGDMSESEATELAALRVGAPGTSEHELGLAVDFADDNGGEGLLQWLRDNAWHYGFILRYPEGSEEITGRAADPAHFRYVGPAAAEQIHAMDATLEEYLSFFYGDSAQIIFEE